MLLWLLAGYLSGPTNDQDDYLDAWIQLVATHGIGEYNSPCNYG